MNTIRVVLRGHSWTLPPPAIALTTYPTLLHGSLPCGSVSTPPSQPTAPQLLFMTTTIGCRTYKCRSSSSPYFCLSFRQVGNSCLISKSCPRHGRLCCLPCTTDLKTRVGVFWRLKISLLLLLYHQKVWHAHLGYPSICIHKKRGCVHLSGAPLPNSICSCWGHCFERVNDMAQPPKAWKNEWGHWVLFIRNHKTMRKTTWALRASIALP